MSELDQQPAGGVSRRTVTKAMAWAVPAIAIAAPAPAFAVSGGVLQLTGTGCKLPGNATATFKGYAFGLTITNNTNNPLTVQITNITLNGTDLGAVRAVNLDTCVHQDNPFTIPANTSFPNVALLTANAANSSNGTLSLTYTTDNGVTHITITATVNAAPPTTGASCHAFTSAQKTCINNSTS